MELYKRMVAVLLTATTKPCLDVATQAALIRMRSTPFKCVKWKLLSPDNKPVKNVAEAVRLWDRDCRKTQNQN